MHCDNKGNVNSLRHSCGQLGAVGCPLLVYHGLADTNIDPSVGKQVSYGMRPEQTHIRAGACSRNFAWARETATRLHTPVALFADSLQNN